VPELDISALIGAPPQRILKAFFEPDALHAWWQVAHAVTAPRVLGPYAVAWETTEFRDEVLGRLGGILRGTVMQFQADRGFFVADVFWLPPDGDPIGPMAFEVVCTPAGSNGMTEPNVMTAANGPTGMKGTSGTSGTHVRVTQQGYEESERWRRYYEVIGDGWERALASLKALLEK
jgi:uncharacterized protein YndB with AHSA1/START domain